MNVTRQVKPKKSAPAMKEQQGGLGPCARLWNRFIAYVFGCYPRLVKKLTIANKTPNQDLQQRTIETTTRDATFFTALPAKDYHLDYANTTPDPLVNTSSKSSRKPDQGSATPGHQESCSRLDVTTAAANNLHHHKSKRPRKKGKEKQQEIIVQPDKLDKPERNPDNTASKTGAARRQVSAAQNHINPDDQNIPCAPARSRKGRLPEKKRPGNHGITTKPGKGIQAQDNNCCFASLITALNSQRIIEHIIAIAEKRPNASTEVIDTLRLLILSSENDFIDNRHLERLRVLLNHPHGEMRDMMEILDVLFDKLDIKTWSSDQFTVSSNITSPVQYVQLNVMHEDPFFERGKFDDITGKTLEELLNILYRSTLVINQRKENETDDAWITRVGAKQNLRGWPTEESVKADGINTPREIWKEQVRKAELQLDPNNAPKIILATYHVDFHGHKKPINGKVILKGDNGHQIIYDVVSMTSIERSHFYAWNIDRRHNMVTFHDSMADQNDDNTCLPCIVSARGILGAGDTKAPLFKPEAAATLQRYKESGKRDYNIHEKFNRLPMDVSLVVLKLNSIQKAPD